MSSNRLMYDTCAYKKALSESVAPINYMLYPGKYENCSKCRIELGVVGGNNVSLISGNLVDLESDLRGQTRQASLCPSNKYQPKCNGCKNSNDGIPCSGAKCQEKLIHQPACQMHRYPKMPMPPAQQIYNCNYPSKGQPLT